MKRPVVVVQTGTANTASVLAALRRQGLEPRISNDPAAVAQEDRVVLPGVGAFGPAMQELHERELLKPLQERVRNARPTLAICLGLQLLAEGSEESPQVPGLSVFPGVAERFPGSVRVPQLGWNRIQPEAGCRLLHEGHVYFANSYRLVQVPEGWCAARSEHGGTFVAALERGPVLACQFHPELSGAFGAALLRRWIDRGDDAC